MIRVTLPNGKELVYDKPVDGMQLAKDISISLSKAALAMKVNDKLVDLSDLIEQDASIEIITAKDKEGLEIIRHDAAHVLAYAIKNLFPDTQITIGPVIEDGFYYDILPSEPLSEKDLPKIEKEMKRICEANYLTQKETWNRKDAIDFFKKTGESFKAELITDIPEGETITVYKHGDFLDLCRGPHAPSTKSVKYFKLTKIAGAYWKGDSKNIMLQRIYGTAWATKEGLDQYLYRIEEAEKRNHRKLGKQLDLFHLQEEAPGMIFWHDRGYTLYRILENYIRDKIRANGYTEVKTPILADRSLWEKSGHWDKFQENMFITEEIENRVMALKPMNCPLHVEIFKTNLKSYRNLPLRMAEFGSCHRKEPSGSLHGLMRVRGFAIDDAHIFCTEDQIVSETVAFTKLLQEVYKDFGFTEINVKFSDRPEKRAGSDEIWDKSEASLKKAVEATGLEYELNRGEGAFYGPKLEFVLKDAIGRQWQCGTFQVDFVLPERLGATYINKEGKRSTPVMLHRAILGSLERFIGILIEHYEGKFPLWLAPVQVAILSITDSVKEYGQEILEDLKKQGIRAIFDDSNDKINYKIRVHSLQKIPMLLVIGNKEKENNSVVLRVLGKEEQMVYNKDDFYSYVTKL
ncbi:MAG: threonine--tRNA ligase [Rickettsiales bacterium]|nr:threonine--tRNA ligase [Rickettsiales bacterium]